MPRYATIMEQQAQEHGKLPKRANVFNHGWSAYEYEVPRTEAFKTKVNTTMVDVPNSDEEPQAFSPRSATVPEDSSESAKFASQQFFQSDPSITASSSEPHNVNNTKQQDDRSSLSLGTKHIDRVPETLMQDEDVKLSPPKGKQKLILTFNAALKRKAPLEHNDPSTKQTTQVGTPQTPRCGLRNRSSPDSRPSETNRRQRLKNDMKLSKQISDKTVKSAKAAAKRPDQRSGTMTANSVLSLKVPTYFLGYVSSKQPADDDDHLSFYGFITVNVPQANSETLSGLPVVHNALLAQLNRSLKHSVKNLQCLLVLKWITKTGGFSWDLADEKSFDKWWVSRRRQQIERAGEDGLDEGIKVIMFREGGSEVAEASIDAGLIPLMEGVDFFEQDEQ